MAEISAALVQELRKKTSAGMMDCKKALAETAGDMESAVNWLRKAGITAAAQKAGRATVEGLVGVAAGTERRAAMVEVNVETDFVARHEIFQDFVHTLAKLTLTTSGDITEVQTLVYPGTGRTVAEELTHLIATIGENIRLCRTCVLSARDGVVASYVHNAVTPALGRIGVLVALEATGNRDGLAELGHRIAMHIAATSPQYIDIDSVDKTALARERDILTAQAHASGKPDSIIAQMVEGRLRKYYEEVVLLEQVYVIDGESRMAKVIKAASEEVGALIHVSGFNRFSLGEGANHAQRPFPAERIQGQTNE
ncbi:Translation elongation factor Ts [invertebrate metagenome]|uniref:Translation elongation factor Ts n=1 Tax=invertebrate metagenome TaxID=1711999 RepID=A0A484H5Z0_9ZZZZ